MGKNSIYELYCDNCDVLIYKTDDRLNIKVHNPYWQILLGQQSDFSFIKPKDQYINSNYHRHHLDHGSYYFCSDKCFMEYIKKTDPCKVVEKELKNKLDK